MFQLGSGEYGGFGGAWLILTTLNEMSYYPGRQSRPISVRVPVKQPS